MRSSFILWLAWHRQQIVVAAVLVGVSTAHASTTPTPTPTAPVLGACVPIPCAGDCAMPAPCTPGAACPQYVVKGTCEVVSNTCACVTNLLTPVPTPTFGGCGLSCDDRPCSGQCADGSVVNGFCSSLTVDRGCACAFGCASPTPTPLVVCTPPPCKPGDVFSCPGSCPGGCGTLCAAPTQSPTTTATPTGPCVSVPCGGACAMCPPCTPGTVCPEAPCYLGACQLVAGSCACVPGMPTPTPTPIPTVNQCDPSAQNCPVGKQCTCCCGSWVCMPPYLPCCALPCSEPTPLPTPTATPSATPTRGECNPLAPDCPADTPCSCCCGRWECLPPDAICCLIACSSPPPPPTPTPTFPPATSACIGDCNSDGNVDVAELVTGVNIALGTLPFGACPAFDCTPQCRPGPVPVTAFSNVNVGCLIRAVNNALSGCPPAPCQSDEDCDDGNGCSIDRCTPNGCEHQCVCV